MKIILILTIITLFNIYYINSQVTNENTHTIKIGHSETITIDKTNTNKIENNRNNCYLYKLNSHYNKMGFHLYEIDNNINRIVVTDKLLDNNCEKCDDNAEICQTSINNTSDISQRVNFFSKMCIDTVYLYVITDNSLSSSKVRLLEDAESSTDSSNDSSISSNSEDDNVVVSNSVSFKFDSSYFKNQPCFYRHDTQLSYCGQSSIEDCKNCRRLGCSHVECGSNVNNKFNKMYDLCLPYTMNNENRKLYCQEFDKVTTYKNSGNCEYDDLEGYSFFTVFVVFVIVAFLIVMSIVVVYYNVFLMKNNAIPFEPPSYMPGFLFPKETQEMKEKNTKVANKLKNLNFNETPDY